MTRELLHGPTLRLILERVCGTADLEVVENLWVRAIAPETFTDIHSVCGRDQDFYRFEHSPRKVITVWIPLSWLL